MSLDPKFWHRDTSWDELDSVDLPNGATATKFVVGRDPDDKSRPVVFKVDFPPNVTVAPHTHECDYCEIVLSGTQQVGRTWHKPGDVRIAQAGTAYGPLTAGPEGCSVIVVFADGRWPAVPLAGGKDEGLHVDVLVDKLG